MSAPAARRIAVVVGTRPEAIKLATVVHALRARGDAEVQLVTTGQHGALCAEALAGFDLAADVALPAIDAGGSLDALLATLLPRLSAAFAAWAPTRLVVQGDTTSALAAALAGLHRRCPIAHVEAGLRSGDPANPWPEESNRRLIAVLADRHFAPTEQAAAALRGEGIAADRIHQVGNTVIDALLATRDRLARDPAAAGEAVALAHGAADRRLLLVTTHRRENWGQGIAAITRALRRLAEHDDVAVVWPLHPNPAIRSAVRATLGDRPRVALTDPLDYAGLVHLLDRAHLVLTDSGGLQEEAPAFGKPVLVLRDTTERPEGVAAGTARLVGTDEQRIVEEVTRLLDDSTAYAAMAHAHSPYGDGHSAPRIAAVLAKVDGR